MKLSELARTTGTSTATLKFWMREGILPAGALRNVTTAVYDQRHCDRIALIHTLRAEFQASIARIRELTALIDRPETGMLEVMEACQVIAAGLVDGEVDAADRALVAELQQRAGWVPYPSVAAAMLAQALAASARVGFPYDVEELLNYARLLEPIAADDIDAIGPEGSLDAVARSLLVAAAAQQRVLLAMNQLAHTSAAVRRAMAAEKPVSGG